MNKLVYKRRFLNYSDIFKVDYVFSYYKKFLYLDKIWYRLGIALLKDIIYIYFYAIYFLEIIKKREDLYFEMEIPEYFYIKNIELDHLYKDKYITIFCRDKMITDNFIIDYIDSVIEYFFNIISFLEQQFQNIFKLTLIIAYNYSTLQQI